jgi:DNA-binding SARP family transcriptional activator
MDFGILGSLEVRRGGQRVAVTAPKQRGLLAVLLVRANKVVSADQLAEELWEGRPPATARSTLQSLVLRVRRALCLPNDEQILVRHCPGYLFRVQPHQLDANRFEAIMKRARRELRSGAVDRATASVRQALALWRGPALCDVPNTPLIAAEAVRLEELHLAAGELRIDLELASGLDADLVGELRGLVANYPLRERFWAQLMLALYHAGRPAEALAAFHDARRRLAAELGIEPGYELRELHERMLCGDPALAGSSRCQAEVISATRPRYQLPTPHPAQLLSSLGPHDVPAWAVTALVGEDETGTLVDAHVLAPAGTDSLGQNRYRLLDRSDADPWEFRDRMRRLLGTWLALTETAAVHVHPPDTPLRLDRGAPRCRLPAGLTAQLVADPHLWYRIERPHLLHAIYLAHRLRFHGAVTELATALTPFSC